MFCQLIPFVCTIPITNLDRILLAPSMLDHGHTQDIQRWGLSLAYLNFFF